MHMPQIMHRLNVIAVTAIGQASAQSLIAEIATP